MTEEKNLYDPTNTDLVKTTVTQYFYSENEFVVSKVTLSADEITVSKDHKNWVRVIGLKDETLIHNIAAKFGIHSLAVEDILHTVQRPKIDEYENALFLVLKMFYVKNEINSQQISFFVKDNLLIRFGCLE